MKAKILILIAVPILLGCATLKRFDARQTELAKIHRENALRKHYGRVYARNPYHFPDSVSFLVFGQDQ